MAETPWWGVPALSGAFAFAAVATAQVVVVAMDRRRVRRESRQRWDDERRRAYVQFIHQVRRRVYEDRAEHDMDHELVGALAEVQLLASADVQVAASDLFQAAISKGHSSGNDVTATAAKLHSAFIEAVRRELGVVSSSRKIVLDENSPFGFFGAAIRVAASVFLDGFTSLLGIRIHRIQR
ncbi:hypothetical protein ABZU25_10090 [Micromonospora sp. NPDC005215]|uniref:hypothetical protein n=1 Tax=Micromonospora sp. NPDC005215 TaxID=3157024 RepID=UPI0033BA9523